MTSSNNRREALKRIGMLAAALAASRFDPTAAAAELTHLSSTNPAAVSLGYVEDIATADQQKFPEHQTTQRCAACKQYQGSAGAEYGPCTLYPGNAVNANGWCSGYVAK